ncbi:hypothetical protein GcC1_083009 [Golovinomyces cichoracearum]|uniref:Uncharacterized protein n=1 Tax=Golovinomyces cichoracearum TaxID=62708 RepID=A0A420IJE2_9PEZI|nr:hypothetical protein GcC1_083009 [Golovinomyces cichoracearum]
MKSYKKESPKIIESDCLGNKQESHRSGQKFLHLSPTTVQLEKRTQKICSRSKNLQLNAAPITVKTRKPESSLSLKANLTLLDSNSISNEEMNSSKEISKLLISILDTDTRKHQNKEIPLFDPVRAALTWKDEEITGYKMNDPEDDGEGINGIGFRPTPKEALIRAQKREKQLAAYKDQEAKHARNLRRERRNLDSMMKRSNEGQQTIKKVRFKEAEIINLSS